MSAVEFSPFQRLVATTASRIAPAIVSRMRVDDFTDEKQQEGIAAASVAIALAILVNVKEHVPR